MGESYNKTPLSFEDQVKLLQSRGLKVEDETVAERFLVHPVLAYFFKKRT